MMTCRELADLLVDFVSGELPADHRDRVQQHLDGCAPCVHYLQTYEMTIRLGRRLPCDPMPDQLAERLRAALTDMKQAGGEC